MHKYIKDKYLDFLKNFSSSDKQDEKEEKFIGKHLKKIRMNYNLSQRCFAKMLNISVKTLQNYEVDRYSIPGTATSLFLFANENIDLFKEYYLSKVENIEPYREAMNLSRYKKLKVMVEKR